MLYGGTRQYRFRFLDEGLGAAMYAEPLCMRRFSDALKLENRGRFQQRALTQTRETKRLAETEPQQG